MPNRRARSSDASQERQVALSRWENEGGSGPPEKSTHPEALTFNKPPLPRAARGAIAASHKTR